jgi:MoxR-like ATPase
MSARDDILALQSRIGESIIRQQAMMDRRLFGLLANGHPLVREFRHRGAGCG